MNTIELDERGLLLPCPQCGQRNRIIYERFGQTFRCGKCHAELHLPNQTVEVQSESSFHVLTSRSALPVVVDFWAPWCGPCKMVAPELEKIARESAGRWVIAKVNTEQLPGLAQKFGISGIPTLLLFRDGREMARQPGAMPATKIRQFVEQADPAPR